MLGVRVGDGESIDSALARFKKLIEREGLPSELKRREFYEKPSEKRKRKLKAALRKIRRKMKKEKKKK